MTGRWLGQLGMCVLLGSLAGCGGSSAPYAEALRDQLAVQQEVLQVVQTVRDDASLKAAQERLKELSKRADQAEARFRALPPADAHVKAGLEEEFGERVLSTSQALLAEYRRISQLPGGEELLRGLSHRAGQAPPGRSR